MHLIWSSAYFPVCSEGNLYKDLRLWLYNDFQTVLWTFVLNASIQSGMTVSRPSTMTFENNQFKNMVIAFHESVAEDKTLIDTLKTVMGKASGTLMKATHNRAYFKEITILLPSTWSDDASYQSVTTETINLADVIITDSARSARSIPQVRSYGACGKQGAHVLLPVDFLTKPRSEPYFLVPEKYFVHAFAQFRWGVFQEYGETGETAFYFSLTSGHPEAIRCVLYLRGLVQKNDKNQTICYANTIDQNTGLYTDDCLWRPYPVRQRVKASMMDHQWISVIETFCADDPTDYLTIHNYEAPSKHNRLCDHRSTWDVISNSDDFSNKNPTVSNFSPSDLLPNFKIVKAKARRRRAVIVIDDDHMEHDTIVNKIVGRLQHEVKHHNIELETKSANTYDAQKSQAEMDKNNNGDGHVIHVHYKCRHIPNDRSMSVISTEGGECLLNTANVNLRVPGTSPGHTLTDRLREAILYDHSVDGNHATIQHADIHLTPTSQYTSSVSLDPSLGKKTQFAFHYERSIPDITIHSPSGKTYDTNSQACTFHEQTKLINFHFENAETGRWTYTIKSQEIADQTISSFISSTPTLLEHAPFIVRTAADTDVYNHIVLHVDVTQGNHPIAGLNVTATIETPSGQIETIQLYDNGAGADNTKNDGIYSRYFTRARLEGTYHVTAYITGLQAEVFAMEETLIKPQIMTNITEGISSQRVIKKRSVTGDIQRHVPMSSVYQPAMVVTTMTEDTTPPSRIVDLKVIQHLQYRNTLVLYWTAPGDDLDYGMVKKYELFIGQDIIDIRALLRWDTLPNYKGPGKIVKQEKDSAAMATETEIWLWKIPPSVRTFAFSVRGIDEDGNKAEMSNVATFGLIN